MESKDIVTEKSLTFLQSVFNSTKRIPCHAYPISSLPYPKETIKKALHAYIRSISSNKSNDSIENALNLRVIKGLYLSLSDFMKDADADFINNIIDTSTYQPEFKSESDRNRYETIVNKAEKEREEMAAEVSVLIPPFTSINLLAIA